MGRIADADIPDIARQYGCLPEELGFHLQNGLIFRRLDDGRVQIVVIDYQPGHTATVLFKTVTDPSGWASVVASVSEQGEDYNRWMQAREFHGDPSL